jgi:enoyl-CoA hydratase
MSDEALVLSETRERVAVLTLNRPERRNALSQALIEALAEALAAAAADEGVGAVVITGAGERAFCAGGDLAGGLGGAEGALATHRKRGEYAELLAGLHTLGKPVIAAVNGDALGGGFGLAIACDLAVADEGARLGTPEINVGLFPMMITAELARNLPRKILLEMVFSGRLLSAEEARAWGMINRVAPAGRALEAALELAAGIAAKSPAVLKLGKDAFYQTADLPLEAALRVLHFQLELNLQAEDAMEGIAAFLQKRPPQWKGR